MHRKLKLVRITTAPISMLLLIAGQPAYMRSHGFEVFLVSADGPEWEKIPDINTYPVFKINMARQIDLRKDFKSLFALIRLFRKIRPDIVHTHTPKAGFLGMIAARLSGVPMRLHTVAGLPLMETKGMMRKILEMSEKITYASSTKIYPNSGNLASFILDHKLCSARKIKVLGNGSSNGIDTEFFKLTPDINSAANKLKKDLAVSDKSFVFVFIGRLVKDKGIEELVLAFALLRKKYNHIKLILVGPFEDELDPLSEEIKQMINADDNVYEVGFQHEIRPYLAASQVLAFPSYREGFPNVPMQAGAMGLPSIVTDINGCNEIIEHEKNGLIIQVKNQEALFNAMERLISDEALYLRLKANARKMIVERYEQKHFWSLLFDEYQDQLKKYGLIS